MVDADYRLLPEANGRDILADIADLLRWLPAHLPALAAQEGLTVDLRRTLFTGGSAGSWLAMQGALRHGTGTLGFSGADSAVQVVAVLSQFGILNNAVCPASCGWAWLTDER
jgi:acetyl esterase/lipase